MDRGARGQERRAHGRLVGRPQADGSRLPLARNTFTARTRLLKVSTPFVEPLHVIISAGQRQTVQGQAAAA
jgi:hypothetical protein